MCPVVVLHGGGREEGVVARGPRALERLFPRVQLHVVVQGPLLGETSITQVACKFPARREKPHERDCTRPKAPRRVCRPRSGWRTARENRRPAVMSV